MDYKMNIAGVERALPLCPLNDKLYIAGFVMFGDVELTEACAKALIKKVPEHDVIVTAESKGIPLTYEMARQMGVNKYVVARKKAKFYMKNSIVFEMTSITTAGKQTLVLDEDDVNFLTGKKVLIVDDVISTGASLEALEYLVNKAGGKIVGKMAVLAEGKAADRDDIIFLNKLPLFDPQGNEIE